MSENKRPTTVDEATQQLDELIRFWRAQPGDRARFCHDTLQSVRYAMTGRMLLAGEEEPHANDGR